MCVVFVVFVVFVFVIIVRNIYDFLEGMIIEVLMKICLLLWVVFKEDKILVFFMILLLLSFVLILIDLFCLFFYFKEFFWLLIIRFVVGIILLLNVCDIINLSYEEWYKESVEVKNMYLELRNIYYNLGLVI